MGMITIQIKTGDVISIRSEKDHTFQIADYHAGKLYGIDMVSGERVVLDMKTAARRKPAGKLVVALLGCSKTKRDTQGYANEVYTGALFKLSLEYAITTLGADQIFILSAKHFVLSLFDLIEPYDLSMANLSNNDRRDWGIAAGAELVCRLEKTWNIKAPSAFRWVILAGSQYTKPLAPFFSGYNIEPETPLAGLGIGKQQALLRTAIAHGQWIQKLGEES